MMERNAAFVVLGATGAVGENVSLRLRQDGFSVVVGGRDAERTEALAGRLDAEPCVVDVTDPDQVAACIDTSKQRFGRLDGIANCAGSLLLKPAHLTTGDEWDSVIRVNLTSAFSTVKAGAKAMQREGGSIVLISSAAARVGLPNHEAIAAAKAGVEGLILSAAATYASRGIRVNGVAPGLVKSQMTQQLTSNPDSLKVSKAMHPLGRVGEPDDVASAIAWLLDARNSWVSGQVIGVDGGLARLRGRMKSA